MMVAGKRAGVVDGVRSDQDTVAVRLGVGHGGLAYPDLVKATQPTELSTIGGIAQQSASSRTGVIPFPVADIPEAGLPIGWTGGVEAAKTIE
jgi:hypothetical protein